MLFLSASTPDSNHNEDPDLAAHAMAKILSNGSPLFVVFFAILLDLILEGRSEAGVGGWLAIFFFGWLAMAKILSGLVALFG